jgi:uncharacterized protein
MKVRLLKINVEEMLTEGSRRLTIKESLSDVKLDDAKLLTPVEIEIELNVIDKEVYVKGEFKTSVELGCVRCLKEFRLDLSGEIESTYMFENEFRDMIDGLEDEYEAENEAFECLEDGIVDVSELVREHIILEIPPYPICDENCEGLEEFEKYKDDGMDSRWQQLLDITNKK